MKTFFHTIEIKQVVAPQKLKKFEVIQFFMF